MAAQILAEMFVVISLPDDDKRDRALDLGQYGGSTCRNSNECKR